MSEPLRALIAALLEVGRAFGCASVSAAYVTREGRLLTLQATRGGIVTIQDEDGNPVAVPGAGE